MSTVKCEICGKEFHSKGITRHIKSHKIERTDLTGAKFGKLTVVSWDTYTSTWKCKCDCGNITFAREIDLKSGHKSSCGCKTYFDLTGQKFNRLQVLERDTTRQGVFWKCKCDCGNITSVASQKLRLGHTKSCGCYHKDRMKEVGKERKGKPNGRLIDLTGKRFGKLLVIEQDETLKTSCGQSIPTWKCRCDCGVETVVSGVYLRTGHTQSCGCKVKEVLRENRVQSRDPIYTLCIGQRFGKLVTIKEVEDRVWLCKCDCGGETVVHSYNLVNGGTQSCGCLISKGEEKVAKILADNHIKFIKQKSFDTCKYKNKLSFDFYVNDEYLIEYDGFQHFEENLVNARGWFTEEGFKEGHKRDMIKNSWCKENNVPLIRIPYTHLDDLCIDDLRLETTKFIVC